MIQPADKSPSATNMNVVALFLLISNTDNKMMINRNGRKTTSKHVRLGGLFSQPPTDGKPFNPEALKSIVKYHQHQKQPELPRLLEIPLSKMVLTCAVCKSEWLKMRCDGSGDFIAVEGYVCPNCRDAHMA